MMLRVELNYALEQSGGQWPTTPGMRVMLMLCADNLGTPQASSVVYHNVLCFVPF